MEGTPFVKIVDILTQEELVTYYFDKPIHCVKVVNNFFIVCGGDEDGGFFEIIDTNCVMKQVDTEGTAKVKMFFSLYYLVNFERNFKS